MFILSYVWHTRPGLRRLALELLSVAIGAGDPHADPAAGSVLGSVHGETRSLSFRAVFANSHEVTCLPTAEMNLKIPVSQQNFLVYMVLKSALILSLKCFASFLK